MPYSETWESYERDNMSALSEVSHLRTRVAELEERIRELENKKKDKEWPKSYHTPYQQYVDPFASTVSKSAYHQAVQDRDYYRQRYHTVQERLIKVQKALHG